MYGMCECACEYVRVHVLVCLCAYVHVCTPIEQL